MYKNTCKICVNLLNKISEFEKLKIRLKSSKHVSINCTYDM